MLAEDDARRRARTLARPRACEGVPLRQLLAADSPHVDPHQAEVRAPHELGARLVEGGIEDAGIHEGWRPAARIQGCVSSLAKSNAAFVVISVSSSATS